MPSRYPQNKKSEGFKKSTPGELANEDVLSGESEGEPIDHLDIYDSDGYQPSDCPDSEDDYPSTDEIATAEPLVNVSVQQPISETVTYGVQEMTSSEGYEENKARVKIHTRSIIPKILKNGGLKFREFCHICDSWLTNFSDHYSKGHPRAANESHGDFKQRKELAFRIMNENKKQCRAEYFELEAKKKREVARRNKRSTEIRELDGGDVSVDIVSERAIFLDKVRDEVTKNFAVVRDLMATMDSYPEQPHEVKATLKRLGLYDMYNDPIIEEYITYQLNMARRGKGVGNENKPSKELISESNTLKRIFANCFPVPFTNVSDFVDFAEIPLLEYFSIVRRLTNSKTITNYRRPIKNFIEFLRVQKLRSGVLDDRNMDQALTMILKVRDY